MKPDGEDMEREKKKLVHAKRVSLISVRRDAVECVKLVPLESTSDSAIVWNKNCADEHTLY